MVLYISKILLTDTLLIFDYSTSSTFHCVLLLMMRSPICLFGDKIKVVYLYIAKDDDTNSWSRRTNLIVVAYQNPAKINLFRWLVLHNTLPSNVLRHHNKHLTLSPICSRCHTHPEDIMRPRIMILSALWQLSGLLVWKD